MRLISGGGPRTAGGRVMTADLIEITSAQHQDHESRLANRLLKAVILKLLAELLFLCAATSIAAFAYFNPALRGEVELVDVTRVEGWACDPFSVARPLEVQLFIDNRFVAATVADRVREDLITARLTRRVPFGFSFALNRLALDPGRHWVQVYVVYPAPRGSKTLVPINRQPCIVEIRN